jgi:hypothetical protein
VAGAWGRAGSRRVSLEVLALGDRFERPFFPQKLRITILFGILDRLILDLMEEGTFKRISSFRFNFSFLRRRERRSLVLVSS